MSGIKVAKALPAKKPGKLDRERMVLFGLIEHYIKSGKPVGSNTLKEAGFEGLSSATIRNYFANLEQEGYLAQQHSSGGRIPTDLAYRIYASEHLDAHDISKEDHDFLLPLRDRDTKEIIRYLQEAADSLSTLTKCAVFFSAPRFDHDFVKEVKLVAIDHIRCLAVIITDFGVIKTETVHTEKKLSAFTIKRLESYFQWRLTGYDKPENLDPEEEQLAQSMYNELMVRFVVGYANFTQEEIFKTGFSTLLQYPEFHDPGVMADGLGFFENAHAMRLLTKECAKLNQLKAWVGSDLEVYTGTSAACSVIAIPYHIMQHNVGAFGIIGPVRIPYKRIFGILREFQDNIRDTLTKNVYKFKITYRQPQSDSLYLHNKEQSLLEQSRQMLLEDKRNK